MNSTIFTCSKCNGDCLGFLDVDRRHRSCLVEYDCNVDSSDVDA